MSLGEQLRSARESKGLTISDVARVTFIRANYLEAIERDDFSAIPPSRLRYFVQDYARSVDLDPTELLKKIPEFVPPPPSPAPTTSSRSIPSIPVIGRGKESRKETRKEARKEIPKEAPVVREFGNEEELPPSPVVPLPAPEPREPRRRRPRYSPLDQGNPALVRGMMTIAVLLLVGLGIYFLAGGFDKSKGGKGSEDAVAAADTSGDGNVRILARSEGGESGKDTAGAAGEIPESGDSLTLQGRAMSQVWYSIKMDSRQETGTIDSGQTKIWKAQKQFAVSLGNAGGLTFTLNGKPIGALGPIARSIRGKIITAEGVQQSVGSRSRSASPQSSQGRSSRGRGNAAATSSAPANRMRTLESTEPRRAVEPH